MESLNRSVEVDANAVPRLPRILVCEGEDEGGCLPERRPPGDCRDATFRLAEVNHVQGHGKVPMVVGGISPKQLRRL